MRVLIADDHAVFRSGLKALLEKEGNIQVIGETGDGPETLAALRDLDCDVLILDISLPGMSGTKVAQEALKLKPHLPIVVLTMHEDESYMRELFSIGVRAFVLKKSTGTELLQALSAASQGKQYIDPSMTDKVISSFVGRPPKGRKKAEGEVALTPREQEVCELLALGHTNQEIAERLFISERTVETHRMNIMGKLGLSSRAELVRYAIEKGLLKFD